MNASRNISLGQALSQSKQQLKHHSQSPGLDAQVLLAHILDKKRAWVLAHPEYILTEYQKVAFQMSLNALMHGIPLPYIIGEWEFFGLPFKVSPDVIIPRPETELLVERAIAWLQANPKRRNMAEAGTGTGCISISIAKYIADINITAIDISFSALKIAELNAFRHEIDGQIAFMKNDLLNKLKGPFDLICANLPYIPSERLPSLDIYGKEPTLALDGGEDGLAAIGRLILDAPSKLSKGGLILLEIDESHAEKAQNLAQEAFPEASIEVQSDLAGLTRLLLIQTD